MSSLIEGYNYDIFISYRQKDNKYDGWVTEFVDNLKKELEATFKEEISVYFDINPHDGLLETHDVDESLKEKLKCLVFIPIISRTYCDPKSFAWEHEFKAFVDQASRDQFGLKIKLPNGNVASRVLPVRIYDLDDSDIRSCESVLGGVLRGVDFIYKSAGVNRPLRYKEEKPQDNLNNTLYRDQINKVANAIKEVITATEKHEQITTKHSKEVFKPAPVPERSNKTTKIIAGTFIALALIILGIIFIPKLIKSKEQLEKSIAVLPFKLLSDEPDKQYLADGMMDAITLHLSKIKELRVLGRTSTEQYRNPGKTLTAIGKDLNVSYLLEGSFQKFGDSVRLIVQLIRTGKEGHVWANNYDRLWNNIFSVQSEVAQSVASELNAVITPEEKQSIDKVPTVNLTAYEFYLRAIDEHQKHWLKWNDIEAVERAEELYHLALDYDSTFAQAYEGLANVYWHKHYGDVLSENYLDSMLILLNIALSFDDQLASAYVKRGDYYQAINDKEQAIKEYDKALELDPNDWVVYLNSSNMYDDEAIIIEYLLKAASLHRGYYLSRLYRRIAISLNAYSQEKSGYYLEEALKLDNDSADHFLALTRIENRTGNFEKAIEYGNKSYLFDSTINSVVYLLGINHSFLGQYEESLEYFKKYEVLNTLKIVDPREEDIRDKFRIGYAYWMNGFKEEGEHYIDEGLKFYTRMLELNRISHRDFSTLYGFAAAYTFQGEREKAYEYLRLVSQKQKMTKWMINDIKNDPIFDNIRNEADFQQILHDIEAKYQAENERVMKWLEEQDML